MAGTGVRTKVALLGGQAVLLGLMMAFLVVPASALFLHAYGADKLAWVYLGVAAAGVGSSWAMSRAQRRWSLTRLGLTMLAVYTVVVAACWALVAFRSATMATAALLVLFPLSIPLGFVIVGAQAGRLLDVRELKASFPRVAAGFSVGFAVGGLAAAALVGPFGGPEHLLAVDVVVAFAFVALVSHTGRRYAAQLGSVPEPADVLASPRRSVRGAVRSIVGNPLVLLVFGYQFLSAAVTQLLDWTVWNRAALRYPDPSDLARFQGVFGAVINVTSVLFVFGLAGWLLTRYGIRLGLAANPLGVLVLLVVSLATGWSAGAASTAFFLVVCAQQVVDLSLTDGTTRASVNATYQALDARERFAAQTRVEAAGVPLALGFVGVVLLVWPRLGLGMLAVLVLTLVLTLAWGLLALLGYREYGRDLRRALGSRAWVPVALRIDDPVSREVVGQLLTSRDPTDVRLGLDLVAQARPQDLAARVGAALDTGDPGVQEQALEVIAIHEAHDGAEPLGAATHAAVIRLLHEPTTPTSVRALAARVAYGWADSGADLVALERSPDPRLHASGVVGALHRAAADHGTVTPEQAAAVHEFVRGLTQGDAEREALLAAAAEAPHPRLAPTLVGLTEDPRAEGLEEVLVAHATWLLPHALDLLVDPDHTPTRGDLALLRALGTSGEPACRESLVPHLGHRRPEVADAIRTGLVLGAEPVSAQSRPLVLAQVVRCCERASRAERTRLTLGSAGAAHTLLRRALTDEVAAARSVVAELIHILPQGTALVRVMDRLAEPDHMARALATETLEVSLGRDLALRLVDLFSPRDTGDADDAPTEPPDAAADTDGLQARTVQQDPYSAEALLERDTVRALVRDPDHQWDEPWLRACALQVAADICPDVRDLAAPLTMDPDPVVSETAHWVLAHTAPERARH